MNYLRRIWYAFRTGVVAVREAVRYSPDRSRLRSYLQTARKDWAASDREIIQGKARFWEENTGIVQRLASTFETYTAGNGLQITPASSNPIYNAAAKEAWDRWCQIPDLNSRQTFGQIQSLWARRWFVDGEIFVLKTYSPDTRRPRIQNFEANLCKTPDERKKDPNVFDGIAFMEGGRPLGYFLGIEDNQGEVRIPAAPKSADFVIHIFEPERAGQVRGAPFITSVINELHDLDDLQMLEMRAAKEEARTVNIVKNKTRELDPNQHRQQRFSASEVINTGATVTTTKSSYVSDAIGGETVALGINEDMVRLPGVRPSKASMDYWQELKEEICIGTDIPYVLVYPDSMQGTVYRGSLDMASATFRARSSVIAAASRNVYEYVMSWEHRNAPAGSPLRTPPPDWRNVTVSCPRAPNVDVGRNSSAMIEELKHGVTNFDLIYGPLGLNWLVELGKFENQLEAIETKFPRVAKLLAAQSPQPQDPAAEAMRQAELDAIPT